MTNHWNDIDNASLMVAMGANPSENHPACFAHINAARFGKKAGKLVVIDPRQTRTARQCDPARGEFYVRIRPGTDIAFLNALINYITGPSGQAYNSTIYNNMVAWHNGTASNSTAARAFYNDAGDSKSLTASDWAGATYTGGLATSGFSGSRAWPKYCDSRFLVNQDGTDYVRSTVTTAASGTFSNIPVVANSITDAGTVWQNLRAHVRPYTLEVAAGICRCTTTEIENVAKILMDNSRFASVDFGQIPHLPQNAAYKATTFLYAMGQTQHTYGSQNIKCMAELQVLLGNMGRAGGGINALRGIHNVQGSTDMGLLFDGIPGYGTNPPTGGTDVAEEYKHYQNYNFGNRIKGATASSGGADCLLQSGTGNFTTMGLQQRGFHNMTQEFFGNGAVDASKMGELYALWPKGDGFHHIEALRKMVKGDIQAAVVWGQNPAVTEPNQKQVRAALKNLDLLVVVDMFETETAACDRKYDALAPNDMTKSGVTYLIPACAHPEEAGSVTNSGRWLQWRERATAPKGKSKADVELMLRFAKALSDKGAFSHITGQWSSAGLGITGTAYDVLYKRNYKWSPDDSTSFEALSGVVERWEPGATAPISGYTGYGSEYVAENVFKEMAGSLNGTNSGGTVWIYTGNSAEGGWSASRTETASGNIGGGTATAPVQVGDNGGDWLLNNKAKSRNNTWTGPTRVTDANANLYTRWGWAWLLNRRVFYNCSEILGDRGDTFVGPGYTAALFTINTNDFADWAGPLAYRKYKKFKDRPSTVAWKPSGDANVGKPVDAATPHWLKNDAGVIQYTSTVDTDLGAVRAVSLAGRFAAFTEPIESPEPELQAAWGVNMTTAGDIVSKDLVFKAGNSYGYAATEIGTKAQGYDLVLTSIRCVEHFQGGPITRNNPYNYEAEPEPWIEINPVDAAKKGIRDGDLVNVITARSNSAGPTTLNPSRTDDQKSRTVSSGPLAVEGVESDAAYFTSETFAHGFRARVDSATAGYQRVGPGVVAIPWHWGDRGLSRGSRANDLCIDAWDANTMIPEYKACLCKIEKA